MRIYPIAMIAAVAAMLATSAAAAGNVSNGETVFGRCQVCHSNAKAAPNKMGPNLFGVVGRKAGTYPGFAYSAAMKNSGIVWSNAKLDAYIASPSTVVPGNMMAFSGVSNAAQRADLIAYLDTLK
jgi:cytochrome c